MDFLKKLLGQAIKGKLKGSMTAFTWADREREELVKEGFTDSQIALSERANRVAGAAWVERQIKL